MKIATSSASFSSAFAAGTLTQLEWLDICANELEVDGVVFDARDFPREDVDYLAQLKKMSADLGLTVAALEIGHANETERFLSIAVALGAPLLLVHAPGRSDETQAWADFAAAVKTTAGHAKRVNVTVTLRAFPQTLCENAADCKRVAKDVDSAWLRFASVPAAPDAADENRALLAKSVIAVHAIGDIDQFARTGDEEAALLIASIARFRGFVVLEHHVTLTDPSTYHHAVARFAALRARALSGLPADA
ncbi:MAG: sugar phosphate isomerase/epimerase [Candidatus Eremiobacteraeota bacterium]|nr:sugar phosphate isomerase/epimerase [Candidatus Eremiobacteraeota bacterium]